MTGYQVAIPSRGRADRLASATVPMLRTGGVPADRMTVWVAGADEVPTYTAALIAAGHADIAVRQHGGPTGMGAARNAIIGCYPTGTRLLQVDDDVRALRTLTDDGTALRQVTDVHGLIGRAFDRADQVGVGLWGIYPAANAYFMRPRVTLGLVYVIGCVYGLTVTGGPVQHVTTDDKEDVERTLLHFCRDGAVMRLDSVTADTRYYSEPGGMQIDRTPDTITAGARAVVSRWPDLASLSRSRSRGTAEVRLRRLPTATQPPIPAP